MGITTGVGRGLLPRATKRFARRRPGWRIVVRQASWEDPSCGLDAGLVDLALTWAPVSEGYDSEVIAVEPRVLAVPQWHHLAGRDAVSVGDVLDEPFVALRSEASAQRDFWLAVLERGGREPVVGAVVRTPDEAFEAVAGGLGLALVAAGNIALYPREAVTSVAVADVGPARLVAAWPHHERRIEVADLVAALVDVGAERSAVDTAGVNPPPGADGPAPAIPP